MALSVNLGTLHKIRPSFGLGESIPVEVPAESQDKNPEIKAPQTL